MAAYICQRCEIEGQDLEVSPGQVFCWNCGAKAVITARIVIKGASPSTGPRGVRAEVTDDSACADWTSAGPPPAVARPSKEG